MEKRTRHYFQWHITHACNLRCIHCYQQDYSRHMSEEMLFRVLDMYTAFVEKHSYDAQINLTGGEPLLHPAFYKLCREIRRRNYRLGILTNGTMIDEKAAEELASLTPVFIQISLDGTEEVHDGIRGKGSFARALHGIDLLKRRGVRVLVSFTAQKVNWRSFEELAAICHTHKVDKLWWDRVVTENEEDTRKLALSTAEFQSLVEKAEKLRKRYLRWNGGLKSMISMGRALQAKRVSSDNCYICSAGKNLIIVLANGDVMPCRRLPFVIGNVNEKSLTDVIENSGLMKKLAIPGCPDGCQNCKRLPYCRGGARCVTYGQTGKLNVCDVNCFYRDGTYAPNVCP